jgi:hypothetical protein
VALFVTGALMSVGKATYEVLRAIHIVAPFLAVIAMVIMIYLFTGKNL